MDGPQLASSDLGSVVGRLVVVPRQLIGSGVFPCFDHLPSL